MKSPTPRARRWRLVAIIACVGLVSPLLVGPASAAAPSLQLVGPGEVVELGHYKGQATYLDTGVLLASVGAPFEIEVTRPDYTGSITAAQVIDGNRVPLDPNMPVSWDGFEDFFHIEITKAGAPVTEIDVDFCPNSYDRQRISDEGPLTPRYPEACFANPFTKGMVWGIDQDWGTSTVGYYGTYADLTNGQYEVTTSISEGYALVFDVPEEARSTTTIINVTTMKDPCHDGGCGSPEASRPAAVRKEAVPIMDNPAPSILPDLEALPAWGISVQNKRNGKSFVTFGATVWTSGAADMVVEGFRRPDEAVMDGWQYFHDGAGNVIGKSQVGTLEYDQKDGHNHWHFLQFAGYSLLDAEDAEEGVRSQKEAFCLAPTDAIDLTLDGAAMNPQLGLSTACGNQNSRWIREILPLGWGDTYFQGLPGQSFNITNLPNGEYWIEVEANPDDNLHELTDANNVQLRKIELKGAYGKRKVVVPPWNGIDTD